MLSSREKISIRQAVILFIMFVYSPTLRLYPINAARIGQRAGWLTPVLNVLPFICLVFIIQALFKNDKNANLSDIIHKSLGKFFGSAILILYLIWLLITLGVYVRYFGERFLVSLLPNTHINFFTVTILAAVFYVLQKGIVYITRTAEFLFLVFSLVFIFLFLLSIPNLEIINLFPVTYHDALPLIKSALSSIGLWGAFTLIFFFGDKINNKEHIKRYGLQSAIYLVITAMMVLIQTIGVYGYSVIERLSLPYIFAVKSISILQTLERIESLAVAAWIIVDFVAISVILYIVVSIIKSLFSLSDEKSLVSPVAIFAFIFSQYIASDRFELENYSRLIS
ncbi:MAG TPA: endospore germination permease, partial [Clostridiaceae bacterium]|nr:endospore germination permease [Clostridiaceae bacterium]